MWREFLRSLGIEWLSGGLPRSSDWVCNTTDDIGVREQDQVEKSAL
jgi:hypothetical protein